MSIYEQFNMSALEMISYKTFNTLIFIVVSSFMLQYLKSNSLKDMQKLYKKYWSVKEYNEWSNRGSGVIFYLFDPHVFKFLYVLGVNKDGYADYLYNTSEKDNSVKEVGLDIDADRFVNSFTILVEEDITYIFPIEISYQEFYNMKPTDVFDCFILVEDLFLDVVKNYDTENEYPVIDPVRKYVWPQIKDNFLIYVQEITEELSQSAINPRGQLSV